MLYSCFLAANCIDSLTVNKILVYLKDIDARTKGVPWIPFLSALLGGVLVLLGQYIDRYSRSKKEQKAEVLELFTKCEYNLTTMKFLLQQLAFQKVDREYWWWAAHCVEFEEYNSNEENYKYNIEKSYAAKGNILGYKDKIGEVFSEYASLVSKFKLVTKSQVSVDAIGILLNSFQFSDPEKFDLELTDDVIELKFTEDVAKLYREYLKKLTGIENVHASIEEMSKKIINGNSKKGSS